MVPIGYTGLNPRLSTGGRRYFPEGAVLARGSRFLSESACDFHMPYKREGAKVSEHWIRSPVNRSRPFHRWYLDKQDPAEREERRLRQEEFKKRYGQ
jgi:hypothetical protein